MGDLNKDSHTRTSFKPMDNCSLADAFNQNKFENRSSSPSPQVESSNSIEATTCLITPPSIHIGHMYVYNFSPDQSGRNSSAFETPIKSGKYQSPAASSGPICRICHEGDGKEDLVSPCRCMGTVGLVHKSCMERWLSTRPNTNDKCEICNYTFVTARYPKSVLEWIRSDENNGHHRRSLMGDVTCFMLLTPLAIVSSFLCVEGARRQVMWGNSLEAGCLMALATFLITIYFVWNSLTLRYHLRGYMRWRLKNQNVKLLRVQRVSTGTNGSTSNSHGEATATRVLENTESPMVSITIPDPEENG